MIEAIKNIDPLWYFNLESANQNIYFIDYRKLSDEDKSLIEYDTSYEKFSLADASFQAFKKGFIATDFNLSLPRNFWGEITTNDQYRFIRKYFHLGWSVYFLLIRLLKLNNPYKEISGFIKNLNVKRVHLYINTKHYIPTNINKNEKVSIILPTLNRYDELKNVLSDLAKQTFKPFEILVIDQSENKSENFYTAFSELPLKVIFQDKKGQWTARNEAIKISKGDFLLFLDDDSRIQEDWIEQHLKCLHYFDSDISAGISIISKEGLVNDKKIFHWAEEFDTGNVIVKRKVFEKVGLFDNTFNGLRMGDTEFGLRAYLNNFKSISNPNALRYHISTTKGGMRDWGSSNAFKPMHFLNARPNLGTLYLFNNYYSKQHYYTFLISRIYNSYIPSQHKNLLGKIAGVMLFILFSFYWIPQLLIHHNKAKELQPNISFHDFNHPN